MVDPMTDPVARDRPDPLDDLRLLRDTPHRERLRRVMDRVAPFGMLRAELADCVFDIESAALAAGVPPDALAKVRAEVEELRADRGDVEWSTVVRDEVLAILDRAIEATSEPSRNHGQACWEQGCTAIPCWRLGCEHHGPMSVLDAALPLPPPPAPGLREALSLANEAIHEVNASGDIEVVHALLRAIRAALAKTPGEPEP